MGGGGHGCCCCADRSIESRCPIRQIHEPMNETHTAKTVRGVAWSYVSTAITACLQIVLGAILARLLTPTAFGLVAMATAVLRFGQYFAQMGLSSAIVQKPALSEGEIRAAFWASVGLGATAFGVAWLAAPLVAAAFREPEVVAVFRVLGIGFLITGASTTSLALLRRRMRFRELAVVETASYALGFGVVGVILAIRGFGVWSLVVAALSQSLATLVGSYWTARHSPIPTLSRRDYGSLLGFGSRVSVIGILEFLGSNLDTLAVGRFLGPAALGFYSRALSLANLPVYYLSTGLSRVLLPSLARVAQDRAKLRRVLRSGVLVLGSVAFPLAWSVAADARDIVSLLLGPKWAAVVLPLAIVGLAAPLTAVTHVAEVLLEARGALGTKLAIRGVHVLVFCLALVYAARFGVVGYAVTFALSELALHVVYGIVASASIGLGVRPLMQSYVPGVAVGVLTAGVVYVASLVAVNLGLSLVARLALEVLAGASVFVLMVLRSFGGRIWWTLRRLVVGGAAESEVPELWSRISRLAAKEAAA